MSEESGVSLKDHIDTQIKSLLDLLEERRRGDKDKDDLRAEAVKTALASILVHLASMNEFRLALSSQQETLATKESLKAEIKIVEQQLAALSTLVTALVTTGQGKEKTEDKNNKVFSMILAAIIGVGGLIIGVVGFMK